MSDRFVRTSVHKMISEAHSNLGEDTGIVCPCCGCDYSSAGKPYVIDGEDDYRAGWGGRGDLVIVPFSGECESEWDLCIGYHKGSTEIFVRIREACSREPISVS